MSESLGRLLALVDRLRAPDGCPWDQRQTPQTLLPYVREELAEVAMAAQVQPALNVEEELGDLLFVVLSYARAVEVERGVTLDDAVAHALTKMKRRHPAVFGHASGRTWDQLKDEERTSTTAHRNPVSEVPRQATALDEAFAIGAAASTLGFDWPDATGPRHKILEELREIDEVANGSDTENLDMEMGDLLFSVVNFARKLGIHPHDSLRRSNEKFRKRFERVMQGVVDRGWRVEDCTAEDWDMLWSNAKESC